MRYNLSRKTNKREVLKINVIEWIEKQFRPELCTSDQFIFDDMDSQSGYSLPIIYKPFDCREQSHWIHRGFLYDFLYSVNGEGKKLLDFGPGDGWPSLIIAPYAQEVVGLDSSTHRVKVCRENARRLKISNAKFQSYVAGEKIPFDNNTFDGITAASSIEQTPDPKKTLIELYRVLKPDGRLRFRYESLNNYRNGREKESWVAELRDKKSRIVLFDRKIEDEYVIQYGISLALTKKEVMKILGGENNTISYKDLTIPLLEGIRSKIIDIKKCKTTHPSGKTIVKWLADIGFKKIIPSHSGGVAAAYMYNYHQKTDRVNDVTLVDQVIKPIVKMIIRLEAPLQIDPAITAIK